jgi:hypothetical protein
MSKTRAALVATLLLLGANPALAGEITDAGAAAEQAVTDGDYEAAFDSIETAKDSIWEQAPLTLKNVTFTAGEPAGYGIYDKRPTSDFKSGETLIVYSEPQGFGYGSDGDYNTIDMALDYELKDASGKSLAKQENFSNWKIRSLYPNKEFMGKLTFSFTGIPVGDYELSTTVHDKNSEKSASFSLKFKIIP